MSGKFEAVVFDRPMHAEVRELPLGKVGPGEVGVAVTTSGVSIGTEYLVLSGEFPGQNYPCLVGYQSVGVVEELGDGVTNLNLGDKIFVGSAGVPDGYYDGAGAGHVSKAVIPAGNRGNLLPGPILVPSNVSDDAASFLVLVSVALEGVRMAGIGPNDLVAIVGQGMVGQLVAQLCVHEGATVFTSDLDPQRAKLSEQHSGHKAFAMSVENFDREIRAMQEKGADVVFDTTGITKVMEQSLLLAKDHGTFVVQGHYPGDLVFKFTHAHWRHLTMLFPCGGTFRKDAMDALVAGHVRVDPLITHRVSLAEAPALYEKIAARDTDILGATIEW